MSANKGRTIAIIGGGIGGLTAAIAFAQQGAQVTLHEQATALTEVGAGVQITPNGARGLDALGVDLGPIGIIAQAVRPVDAMTGQGIARFDLFDQTPPYRFVHRADLIDVLAVAAKQAGAKIHLSSRASPQDLTADIIVAADGLHSQCRGALNGHADPFFTGQVAWRATVSASHAPQEAAIWMAPGRHVVTYPLRDGRLNIVAVQERKDWAAEGWHHIDDPRHLQSAFSDCAPALRTILAGIQDVNLWGLFRHPIAETWHDNKIALVGDAAHPTLPFLAQGANLAIEDAFVLARCLGETREIQKALATYQALRKPRVTRAINAANANARNYHLSGAQRRVAHLGLSCIGRIAPKAFLRKLSWLYDHDVTRSS